jgi:hypothetical protein
MKFYPTCLGLSALKDIVLSKITVHAGDFLKGTSVAGSDAFALKTPAHSFLGEHIWFAELDSVEVASEDAVKRIGGTVGWGVAGAVVLGPVGLLAGLLLGGRGKEVTFVAKFKDGRKILATTDSKTFIRIKAAAF